MPLASRIPWTRRTWYAPAAFALAAFALGAQIALWVKASGTDSYPPEGAALLAWGTLVLLACAVAFHAPTERVTLVAVRKRLGALRVRRARGAGDPPVTTVRAAEPGAADTLRGNGENAAITSGDQRLRVRVHTPILASGVVAPGEPFPITVQAEPAELARELDVEMVIEQGGRRRQSVVAMTEPTLVLTESFDEPGTFTIHITVRHPRADPATRSIEGRVASFRQECGRLFSELKARGQEAGLALGPQSTPREVCQALARAGAAPQERLSALSCQLEVALYGDAEVERNTYETIRSVVGELKLAPRAPSGGGPS